MEAFQKIIADYRLKVMRTLIRDGVHIIKNFNIT